MNASLGNAWKAALGITLIIQSCGCGTILHPEREGQQSGRADVGVVILDAIGLLFFIIPGVIAFAVDFSEGTIYLPPKGKTAFNYGEFRRIRFDPHDSNAAEIETIIKRETGRSIQLGRKNVRVIRLKSAVELQARLLAAQGRDGGVVPVGAE